MTFLQLYGTKLDRELGTPDRTQRFTTVLRKEYVNEGIEKFNEHTGCYTKRASITLVDDTEEYDIESAGVLAAGDYLRPCEVGASIAWTSGSTTTYIEGDELQCRTEERLNQESPGWRSWSPGIPRYWTTRKAGASEYVVLVPAPDITGSDTWALLFPYVAVPPTLSADGDIPYEGRVTLTPYHDGILAYAAAQLEKLRKNTEAVTRQMQVFAGMVAKYHLDQAPKTGRAIRLRSNPRTRLRFMPAVPFGR